MDDTLLGRLRDRLQVAGPGPTGGLEPQPKPEPFMAHAEFERGRYEHPTECEGMLVVEDRSGPVWAASCDVCGFEVGIPMLRVDPERLKVYRLEHAGIPELYAGKTFDAGGDGQADALAVCRAWLKDYRREPVPAIALHGRAGRGKTHLLALMVETLIKRYGAEAMYRSTVAMLDELKAGFGRTAEYEVRWERVLNVGVLALDDLAAEQLTDWRRDRFAALVDHRYSRELPLLVATNIGPEGWESAFGERTASRLKGMCVAVGVKGPDRRQATLLDESAA